MSDQLLQILKYFLVALVWLFFVRVARSAWVEVRRTQLAPLHPSGETATSEAPLHVPSETRRSVSLEVVQPPERRGERFDLAGETTVGRAPGCGVSLAADSFTSQLHARLYLRDGTVWVEDLGSTNGTWLNGERLNTPTRIRKGDRLQVGSTVLELSQ